MCKYTRFSYNAQILVRFVVNIISKNFFCSRPCLAQGAGLAPVRDLA